MRHANLSVDDETQVNASTVLHWYDFVCPFCYVGQQRNAILAQHGLDVVELPFQPHHSIAGVWAAVEERRHCFLPKTPMQNSRPVRRN